MMDDWFDILTQVCVERGLRPPGAEGPRSSFGLGCHEHDGADAEGLSGRRAGIAMGRHPVDEAVQLVGETYQPFVAALSAVRRDLSEGEGRERGTEVFGGDRGRGQAVSPSYRSVVLALRERREGL